MKLGNRRQHRQEYLLEVKVHREGQLRRRLQVVAGLVVALAVVALTAYGLYRLTRWSANRLVYENKRFAIARITVENDGALDPQLLIRFAGVRLGQNLLGVDLQQAQRNLELLPLLRRAAVRRVLPDRLMIHVEERVPVAQLQPTGGEPGDAVYYVDRQGMVMKPWKLADGTLVRPALPAPVPLLTGVPLTDLRVGRPVQSAQIYRALALLEMLDQSGAGTLVQLQRLDCSRPHQLLLVTRQGMSVQFDTRDFAPQLRRLNVILHWARQRQRQVQTVDLTANRGVPVTFLN